MLRRFVTLGTFAVAGYLAIAAASQGCYRVPEPACGFRCGSGGACPAAYTCARDGRCHRDGTPPSLVCAPPDAAPDAGSGSG